MDRSKWFFHPIFIFVISILALGSSLILYIYWYIEVSAGLEAAVRKFNLDANQMLTAQTWVVILVLSVLVGLILLGLFTIFVYSQKMVQLYRLQRNFINNFTHELKTPVASLNLYLETFKKHDLERKDLLKYVDYMLADIKRLSDNISRILNLARIEGRSYTGEFVSLDMAAVLKRFVENNRRLFASAAILLATPVENRLFCRINPSLFEILLLNLTTNAITYNQSKQKELQISLEPSSKRVRIHFRDNGIGFEKHERKRIFKKFYQIGRSDDMTAQGSGIGLYLAQSIAKIHNGHIKAASPGPGQGAVFSLNLPLQAG